MWIFYVEEHLLILAYYRKVTDWISTRISSEKNKPFDTGLEPTMSNLANGRVNLKFSNFVLVFLHCIVNLYIVYELNTWQCNPADNFTLKNCLYGTSKLVRNTIISKFTYNG